MEDPTLHARVVLPTPPLLLKKQIDFIFEDVLRWNFAFITKCILVKAKGDTYVKISPLDHRAAIRHGKLRDNLILVPFGVNMAVGQVAVNVAGGPILVFTLRLVRQSVSRRQLRFTRLIQSVLNTT